MRRRILGLLVLGSAGVLTSGTPTVGTPAADRPVPPEFRGPWLNAGAPVTLAGLRGKVVLVNFWVYSCINCHNSLPTLRAWGERYGSRGLQIVGVHTPEFDTDRPAASVLAAMKRDLVTWPVVQDNDLINWRAWNTHAWPTFYLLDRHGHLRVTHVGEISGRFPQAIPGLDASIRALLAEP